jgi:hypothetical protein
MQPATLQKFGPRDFVGHYHMGGVIPDGRADPKSIAVADKGYAEGGAIEGGGINNFDPTPGKNQYDYVPPVKEKYTPENYDPGTVNFYTPQQEQDTAGYAGGGPVQGGKDFQALADHAMDVYDSFHEHLRNYHTGGLVNGTYGKDGDDAEDKHWEKDDEKYEQVEDGKKYEHPDSYAAGGLVAGGGAGGDFNLTGVPNGGAGPAPTAPPAQGIMTNVQSAGAAMTPPGPAGPGVMPQSPQGNPGRPNWWDPNTEAAAQKNFYQNTTSMPATSPARGTAYGQPPPYGGQRGQEWYGKGASPYGNNAPQMPGFGQGNVPQKQPAPQAQAPGIPAQPTPPPAQPTIQGGSGVMINPNDPFANANGNVLGRAGGYWGGG